MKLTVVIDIEDKALVPLLKLYGFEVEKTEDNPKHDPTVENSPLFITKIAPKAKLNAMLKNHVRQTIKNNFSLLLSDPSIRNKHSTITDDIYYSDSKYLDSLVKVTFKGA